MTDFDADRLGEYRDMLGSAALSRLVFGLRAFSASCAVLEEAVMKEISAADLAAEIKTAQKTFANQSAEVDAFLE